MPVTEFYSARHANPLVVMHDMNVMYFKNEPLSGYCVVPDMFTTVSTMLRRARLPSGGDFYICLTTGGRLVMVIKKPNRQVSYIGIADSDFWASFIGAIKRLQRLVRRRFIAWRVKRASDPFGLRRISAFKAAMIARGIHDDVIAHITHLYYTSKRGPHPEHKTFWYRQLTFVRRIETLSFKEKHIAV